MSDDTFEQPSPHDGHHWSLTFVRGGAVGLKAGALGFNADYAVVEIKDRVSGEVGTYEMSGNSISVNGPLPSGEVTWSSGEAVTFQTGEAQTLQDFQGGAWITGISTGVGPAWKLIRFNDDLNWPGITDMDIVQEDVPATVAYGDSVEISAATKGLSLGLKEGRLNLTLIDTRQEQPDPGLLDETHEIVERGHAVTDHHSLGQTQDLEHAAAEVDLQQSVQWPEHLVPDAEDYVQAEHLRDVAHASEEIAHQQSLPQDAEIDALPFAFAEIDAQQSLEWPATLEQDPEIADHAAFTALVRDGDGTSPVDHLYAASAEVAAQECTIDASFDDPPHDTGATGDRDNGRGPSTDTQRDTTNRHDALPATDTGPVEPDPGPGGGGLETLLDSEAKSSASEQGDNTGEAISSNADIPASVIADDATTDVGLRAFSPNDFADFEQISETSDLDDVGFCEQDIEPSGP